MVDNHLVETRKWLKANALRQLTTQENEQTSNNQTHAHFLTSQINIQGNNSGGIHRTQSQAAILTENDDLISLDSTPHNIDWSRVKLEEKKDFLFLDEEPDDRLQQSDLKNPKVFAQAMKSKLPYYVPILKWLRSYTRQDFFADILAAITVSMMLVPQCLSYAILAGLPPIAGLITGWIPVLIYSLMGSARQLAVGPEALLSTFLGGILIDYTDPNQAALAAHGMALVVGLLSFAFGIFQFGFLGGVLSRFILAGFINAVAVIIAVSQIDALLGIKFPKGSSPFEKLLYAFQNIKETNLYTLSIAISSVAFLVGMRFLKKFLMKKFKWNQVKYIPEIFICVILGIIVSIYADLPGKGVSVLGNLDGGLPVPKAPYMNIVTLQNALPPCVLMVLVGFVEATAISNSLASKYGYSISSNRELVAFGVANIVGSFFGTYPTFSSIPRSSVQEMAGSKTCMTGFIVSMIMMMVIWFMTPLFTKLPIVTMASVIFMASFGLIEIHEPLFLWKTKSYIDLAQFFVAMISTIVFDIEIGVLLSVGMCIFVILKHSSAPHVYSVLGRLSGTKLYKDVVKFPEAEALNGILLIKFEEVLYYANIGQVKKLLGDLEKMVDLIKEEIEYSQSSLSNNNKIRHQYTPIQAIVLIVRNIPSMDASALATIEEMVENYKRRKITLAFVSVQPSVKEGFKRSGILQLIGEDMLFNSTHDAVTYLETNGLVLQNVTDAELAPEGEEYTKIDYHSDSGEAGNNSPTSQTPTTTPSPSLHDLVEIPMHTL